MTFPSVTTELKYNTKELERTSVAGSGPVAVAVSGYMAEGESKTLAESLSPSPVSAITLTTNKGGGGGVSSLLVSEVKTARRLNRKRKRCFHRVISGLERGGTFRVLMLSSGISDKARVQKAFHSLREWGRRHSLLVDYIRVPELTSDGYIHLHIVYRGAYIDRLVLMRKWYSLVGGNEYMPGLKYVYLQGLHSKKGMAHYLAKYMAKGNELAGNYSWSWNWVWPGFVKDWQYLVHCWRCANNGWDEFAFHRVHLPFKWLLDRWRWHLIAGMPP